MPKFVKYRGSGRVPIRKATIAVWLSVAFILSGCASIQKARDNKAIGRVLASPTLTERVYSVAVGLHPVLPQQPKYIKGRTVIDSVYFPVDVVRDSIIREECPSLNIDSLRDKLRVVVTKVSVDTLIQKDTSLIRIINNAQLQNSFKDGELLAQDGIISDLKKEMKAKQWWIFGMGLMIAGLAALCVYIFAKK